VIFQRKKTSLILERKELKANFKQELNNSQTEIQNYLLRNVSWEIHDNIGQLLSLSKLNLFQIEGKDPHSTSILDETREVLSTAITDLRELSHSLNIEYTLENGLQSAVETELARIKRSGSILTTFNSTGPSFTINNDHEIILYRIIQEFIGNSIKHSECSVITSTFQYSSDHLKIEVNDNGKGFDTSMVQGFGTSIMPKRAKLINVDYQLSSNHDTGTTIKLTYTRE